jgi:hypothetical protein
MLFSQTSGIEYSVDNNIIYSRITYKKPILELEFQLFPALQKFFLRLSILELHHQKMVRVHAALYLQVI